MLCKLIVVFSLLLACSTALNLGNNPEPTASDSSSPSEKKSSVVDDLLREWLENDESKSTGSTARPVIFEDKPEKPEDDGVNRILVEYLGLGTESKPNGTTASLGQSKDKLESCFCVPTTSCKRNGRRYIAICGVREHVCCPESLVLTSEVRTIDIPKAIPVCGRRNYVANRLHPRLPGDNIETAKEDEFPWMVAIFKKNDDPFDSVLNKKYLCGGSLIHPCVVLTAAYKVQSLRAAQLIVHAGHYDLADTYETKNYQTFGVMQIIKHSQFNPRTLHNDYGILILSSPAILSDNVGIICLPKPGLHLDYEKCVASSWGPYDEYQQIQKKANLPVIENEDCEDQLFLALKYRYTMHTSLLCAAGQDGEKTFRGDGGSPLVCPVVGDPETFVQAGIVAAGVVHTQINVPGLHANVAAARDWIESVMEDKNLNFNKYQL